MRLTISPTLRITIGMVSLTISLLLAAEIFGFLPDRTAFALEARQKFCEALAVQLSSAASRMDLRGIQSTLESVVERNDDLLSAALRTTRDGVKAEAGEHGTHWTLPEGGESTPEQVQVPILQRGERWGTIELSFRPLNSASGFRAITQSSYGILLFVGLAGFGLYFLFLRRALKEIDPSAVIPERVKAAFDALAEGVIIVDENEYIVLANEAFSQLTGKESSDLTGLVASDLEWLAARSGIRAENLPWQVAMQDAIPQIGVPLLMPGATGKLRTLMVNGTPILDGAGKTRGALATFDDVTDLEKRNSELSETLDRLSKSRAEVKRQNEELRFLATRDPLTGCLNRRAAFERFQNLYEEAKETNTQLSCIMADIDHFKKINDRYGHTAGDKVIKFVARSLRDASRIEDIVARYGGEEFCIILPGLDIDGAYALAERLRTRIHNDFSEKFSAGRELTISLGIASYRHDDEPAMELLNRADKALYAAKASGRNCVIRWDDPRVHALPEQGTQNGIVSADQSMLVEKIEEFTQTIQLQKLDDRVAELDSLIEDKSLELHRKHGFDELTGLPNRILFYDRMAQALSIARREGKFVAALHVDVILERQVDDAFQPVTDENLLKKATERLARALRDSDSITDLDGVVDNITISRLAMTEFGVSLSNLSSTEAVTWIIQRLFDALSEPILVGDVEVSTNCTVGISLYPNDGQDVETMIRHASTACHHAKVAPGQHKYMFFAQEMNERSYEQMQLDQQMRQAIENDEFVLYYQPCFDIRSGRISALEALVRWQHPTMGLLGPDMFIPIAEHTGYIREIGEWVMRTACAQMQGWIDRGVDDVRMAVNLSAIQLQSDAPESNIFSIIDEVGIDPRYVEVEVTETALMDNVQHAQQTLQKLREMGINVAIDDFGTGYSSLSHLKYFVIDKLKIDRSFIRDVTRDNRDAAVVGATIAMAKLLNASVVAEGVETQEQLEFLRKRQCDIAQGFLLSEPLEAQKAGALLMVDGENRRQNVEPTDPDIPAAESTEMFTRLLN